MAWRPTISYSLPSCFLRASDGSRGEDEPEGNLAKGVRPLDGVYTQCFNQAHSRVGHVFQPA